MSMPKSVSNWKPGAPSKKMSSILEPNAKDCKDTLTPDNALEQAVGRKGKPPGPFGKAGREF